MRAGGPHPLLCFQEQVPGERSICIGFVSHLSPPGFRRPLSPLQNRRYQVARLTPRSAHGCRSVSEPTRRTAPGRRAALAPSRRLPEEPALLVPLDAPACPVAAHAAPDATHLRVGQGYRELSIERARPGQQALVRSASGQLAERREQMAVAPRCRYQVRRSRWPSPVGRERARASSARS